jgi:hypothetical protein
LGEQSTTEVIVLEEVSQSSRNVQVLKEEAMKATMSEVTSQKQNTIAQK